jgi:hypothetical protein
VKLAVTNEGGLIGLITTFDKVLTMVMSNLCCLGKGLGVRKQKKIKV